MSEAELHVLRGRMRQGLLNKVRRGEVFLWPPVGYVRSPDGGFDLDPDEQARAVVRLVFDQFERLGTIRKVLRYLLAHGIRLGIRPHAGPEPRPAGVAAADPRHGHRDPPPPDLRRVLLLRAEADRPAAEEARAAVVGAGRGPARGVPGPDPGQGARRTSPGSGTRPTSGGSPRTGPGPSPRGRRGRGRRCWPGWSSAAGAASG